MLVTVSCFYVLDCEIKIWISMKVEYKADVKHLKFTFYYDKTDRTWDNRQGDDR